MTESHSDPKYAVLLRFDANNGALHINARSGCRITVKMNAQKQLSSWFQSLSYPQVPTVGAEIFDLSIDFECLCIRSDPTDPGWK